ncbi:MAG: acyl carrier protein [Leeuwenhoekiella sp.]
MIDDSYDRLKIIIKPYLPEDVSIDAIDHQSHLIDDLNINSTHLVDIVLDVEDAYDITIEDDELEKMDTVKGALALIAEKRQSKA